MLKNKDRLKGAMCMSDFREQFINEFYKNITREGSDDLINWLESSDFFTAPASTKFHSNYEGGLCEHSLNVYECLKDRLSRDGECEYSEETIAIVALLHDVCKVNCYKKDTKNKKIDGKWVQQEFWTIDEKFPCGDHADKSVIILQNFIKLEPDEILAIRAHMGEYDSATKGGSHFISRIFERCRLAVHLHLADTEAAYLKEKKAE